VLVATSTALLRTLRGPLQAVPAIACRVMQPCSQLGRRWRRRGNIASSTHSGDTQCRIKAHSENRPTATGEKKNYLLYICCDFSGWYNFGKIIKIVATRCHILKLKCIKFDFD